MKGIKCLQDHGVLFSVLAVVGHETIDHPEALFDFLASLHGVNIGINIEEYEGANTERTPPTRDQAVAFWRSAISWTRRNPDAPPVRELDRLGRYLRMSRQQQADRGVRSRIDPLPTIAANGDVVLLSPELSGITAPTYDDFRAGNVLSKSIASMLAQASQLR
ncbi:sulfatase maturation enzyme AslB (radical SAM superfamily) [Kitasatospora acidiphila]